MGEIICKCGKKFACEHKFDVGHGTYTNHCVDCGNGAGYDLCVGKCNDCFALDTIGLYEEEIYKTKTGAIED